MVTTLVLRSTSVDIKMFKVWILLKNKEMNEMSTVEELVARSREAQKQFEFATQEQADAAARAVCKAVYDNQEMLGKMAAEESRMGDVNDKIAKCRNKSALIWESLKGKKSVGVIRRIEEKRMLEIAKPVGVVCAVLRLRTQLLHQWAMRQPH